MPFEKLQDWLDNEKSSGASNPQQAVLSTVGVDGCSAHARVVAIREFNEKGFLFFTQKCTRKVEEISNHPSASMTFWFELKQRDVVIEGIIEALTQSENEVYWKSYPREAQIRFCAYAPTSSKPISSEEELELKREEIRKSYEHQDIPMSSDYCGFRLRANRFIFYEYRTPELSRVVEYSKGEDVWIEKLISP